MPKPLSVEKLYTACDISKFEFETTDQLEDLKQIIGQDRALDAMHFGVSIKQEGYNLYVLGPAGLGKHTVVREYLEKKSRTQSPPPDWVYVNNFKKPSKPIAISLKAGQADEFRRDMLQLIEDLHSAIPTAFEAEEYHARVQEIEEDLKHALETSLNALYKEAEDHSIRMIRTPHGFAFAPMKNKEVLVPSLFDELPEKEKQKFDKNMNALEEKLTIFLRTQPQLQRETRDRIKELNREIVLFATGHLIEELKSKYLDYSLIQKFLDAVQQDIIENFQDFKGEEESPRLMGIPLTEKPTFRRYEVNVIVEQTVNEGSPVVFEDNPNYSNLVGSVEHTAHLGALQTDFSFIKPGALHKANGGYLIVDAVKLLTQPYAWEGLKRALSSKEIKIQSLGQVYSLVNTVSLEPEPIPLQIKVVLIGERVLYYLLHAYDSDFKQLFKVSVDFDDRLERTGENQVIYAQLIATLIRRKKLKPFDRSAVARVIEHSARVAEDSEKLSTYIMDLADLLTEADHYAEQTESPVVHREQIQRAINAQFNRGNRIQERLQDEIHRGTIMIDTDVAKVGQMNGLAVIQLGDVRFATPTRITATARLGSGKVVDIERETELGGAIHSKGVYILSSFLSERYAKNNPLSLSASLVFEQSYGVIDGDSASMAELCCLLSALSEIPIKQGFAMTGSVNQRGESQAIGGVNEKIEGFFDVCKNRELTNKQAVLIPIENVKHLMLHNNVVDACRDKTFSVYAYTNVDEAMEILTGEKADKINAKVEARLAELEKISQKHTKTNKGSAEENETEEH